MLSEMRIYTTESDVRYLLVEHEEVISDHIRKYGVWGDKYVSVCERILQKSKPGRVVDVGAGFGTFTIPLAIKFDGKHAFDAIEPLPKINMQLSANILLNNLDNVNVHKCVASDKNEVTQFHSLDFDRSANHGSFSFNTKFDQTRSIFHSPKTDVYEFKKLDEFRFGSVRLIKVTTPAMESQVFMGMYETLVQNEFPPVLFESWNLDWYKEERLKSLDFFAARGYEHYLMIDDHVLAFKTKSQADYLLGDSATHDVDVTNNTQNATQDSVNNSKDFSVTEQKHDRDDVLKHQVGATNL
jgi:FkbM family methyltransferase